ncbi:hypothetical protein [Chryseobacterium jejuense]|uniref:hypothetical protein n=1 Tax=Chryseobacterium jejuense TaxID=445960 RepID=UPI001AE294BA|nr:hypothetical protein [Chryseobacterium jejuense]MBP2617976.1 hypothetical protein [Chryseobacterium jejuense]
MKTVLFLLLFISNFVYSQITIRNESLVEKPYYKPKSFDSISNLQLQERFVDYKQYVGYKVFYKPQSKKYKSSSSENYLDILSDSDGKYFTILDITARDRYSKDREYKKLEDMPSDILKNVAELKVQLKDDKTGDSLYWHVNMAISIQNYPFLLVPYFEKAKKDFVGQRLVAKKTISELIDSKTGKVLNIEPKEIWFCEDLSLTETSNQKYLTPLFYLTNRNYSVVLDIDKLRKSFITEVQYDKIQEEKKIAEAEKIKQEKADEQKRIAEDKKSKQLYINKYGAKLGSLIADNKVAIGMNREMCRLAWGEPLDINRITMKGYAHEQWVYGFGTYLYFNNGILSTIQD